MFGTTFTQYSSSGNTVTTQMHSNVYLQCSLKEEVVMQAMQATMGKLYWTAGQKRRQKKLDSSAVKPQNAIKKLALDVSTAAQKGRGIG